MTHEVYMQRCTELARKALGKTYPNPMVGCVIVHQDTIIGEGYHHKAGENHAEINAINSVTNKDILRDATIYVSLEPCSHFGKTPPCASKIVDMGFKKVVIGTPDPNEKVHGNGIRLLQDAGIEVVWGVLAEDCRYLNKRFFTFHAQKRPFIILKWAQSGDGFIDENFRPVQISNVLTKQFVHQLRSEEHAILVGKNTALTDNPELTVREIVGRNPVRIVIDRELSVPQTFKLYDEQAPTYIFNEIKNADEKNKKFIKIDRWNSVGLLMEKLYQEQIQSVIIEGGRFTLQQFIDENLWDEAIIITNNNLHLSNGTKAPVFDFTPKTTTKIRDNTVEFYENNTAIFR